MLEPDVRALLLDNLRPPTSFVLDRAFGTTYSLDLLALMTAPVAFAMFDRQNSEGEPIDDPIATLQALRQNATRLTMFCQAGQIAVPPEYRSLLVYLENSIYPVVPLRANRVFHPKVWYLRYRNPANDDIAFRLLSLSRNLTFDRSWDTVLRLEGGPGDELVHPELAEFANSLISLAEPIRPLAPEDADALRTLGQQFARAAWELPPGFDRVRFWPMGHDGQDAWPFPEPRSRVLVISPFVTSGTLHRLTDTSTGATLITRPETFDALGGTVTKHLLNRLVLTSSANPVDAGEAVPVEDVGVVSTAEATAGETLSVLSGLHAKTFVLDYTDGTSSQWICSVWTGSANATEAAFHGNVEFLVQLDGPWGKVGVSSFLSDKGNEGLRKLLEPYTPAADLPLKPTEQELIDERLSHMQRTIGAFHFTAECQEQRPGIWEMQLTGRPVIPSFELASFADVAVTCRPLTLGIGSIAPVEVQDIGIALVFTATEDAVTPYFVVALSLGSTQVRFLVFAELIHPPRNRIDRVLLGSLTDRASLMRFLLLLLGSVDDALAAFLPAGTGLNGSWTAALESRALLEPLMRTYARDPDRLRDLVRVMASLAEDPERAGYLPDGWDAIWNPIASELEAESAP